MSGVLQSSVAGAEELDGLPAKTTSEVAKAIGLTAGATTALLEDCEALGIVVYDGFGWSLSAAAEEDFGPALRALPAAVRRRRTSSVLEHRGPRRK